VGQAVSPVSLEFMPDYRRKLPHIQPDDAWLFLTWRRWGTLPRHSIATCYPTAGHAFVAEDRALARHSSGPFWLRDAPIAGLVAETILAGESERDFYELCAWVVMPNHVHILILPKVAVPRMMRWLKGSTARRANQLLGRTGRPFWQDGSYDHYARSPKQRDRIVRYIEENPVSAGLVDSAEDWEWSSAGRQAKALNPR
jgi:putative transposase